MVGAMKTVQPVPHFPRKVPEKRVGTKAAPVGPVTLYRTLQRGQGLLQLHVGRRGELGVDRVPRRYAVLVRPAKQPLAEKEPLETMAAEIEPVHRPVDRIGQVPANLGQRPLTHGPMGRNQATNFRQQLAKIIEGERSTLTVCIRRCNRPIPRVIGFLPQERFDPIQSFVDLLHTRGEGQADVFIHAEGLARHHRNPGLFQ